MASPLALSREQKLLAEIVVQLGNITEAIRAASHGEDSSTLTQQINALQAQVSTLTAEKASLSNALAQADAAYADLQAAHASHMNADVTPDNIAEVMAGLNITYANGQSTNTQSTGSTGNSYADFDL